MNQRESYKKHHKPELPGRSIAKEAKRADLIVKVISNTSFQITHRSPGSPWQLPKGRPAQPRCIATPGVCERQPLASNTLATGQKLPTQHWAAQIKSAKSPQA
jgi:hypothetical protein